MLPANDERRPALTFRLAAANRSHLRLQDLASLCGAALLPLDHPRYPRPESTKWCSLERGHRIRHVLVAAVSGIPLEALLSADHMELTPTPAQRQQMGLPPLPEDNGAPHNAADKGAAQTKSAHGPEPNRWLRYIRALPGVQYAPIWLEAQDPMANMAVEFFFRSSGGTGGGLIPGSNRHHRQQIGMQRAQDRQSQTGLGMILRRLKEGKSPVEAVDESPGPTTPLSNLTPAAAAAAARLAEKSEHAAVETSVGAATTRMSVFERIYACSSVVDNPLRAVWFPDEAKVLDELLATTLTAENGHLTFESDDEQQRQRRDRAAALAEAGYVCRMPLAEAALGEADLRALRFPLILDDGTQLMPAHIEWNGVAAVAAAASTQDAAPNAGERNSAAVASESAAPDVGTQPTAGTRRARDDDGEAETAQEEEKGSNNNEIDDGAANAPQAVPPMPPLARLLPASAQLELLRLLEAAFVDALRSRHATRDDTAAQQQNTAAAAANEAAGATTATANAAAGDDVDNTDDGEDSAAEDDGLPSAWTEDHHDEAAPSSSSASSDFTPSAVTRARIARLARRLVADIATGNGNVTAPLLFALVRCNPPSPATPQQDASREDPDPVSPVAQLLLPPLTDFNDASSLSVGKYTALAQKLLLGAVAFDCEMIKTAWGTTLARLTVVACPGGEVLYDVLARPSRGLEVVDYVTRFSGITPQMLEPVRMTIRDVQLLLQCTMPREAFVVGHSLENDYAACMLAAEPGRVVDSAALFPHPHGPPYKNSLRFLAFNYLKGRAIQGGFSGHDSAEDARSAMDLVTEKLANGPHFGVPNKTNILTWWAAHTPRTTSAAATGGGGTTNDDSAVTATEVASAAAVGANGFKNSSHSSSRSNDPSRVTRPVPAVAVSNVTDRPSIARRVSLADTNCGVAHGDGHMGRKAQKLMQAAGRQQERYVAAAAAYEKLVVAHQEFQVAKAAAQQERERRQKEWELEQEQKKAAAQSGAALAAEAAEGASSDPLQNQPGGGGSAKRGKRDYNQQPRLKPPPPLPAEAPKEPPNTFTWCQFYDVFDGVASQSGDGPTTAAAVGGGEGGEVADADKDAGGATEGEGDPATALNRRLHRLIRAAPDETLVIVIAAAHPGRCEQQVSHPSAHGAAFAFVMNRAKLFAPIVTTPSATGGGGADISATPSSAILAATAGSGPSGVKTAVGPQAADDVSTGGEPRSVLVLDPMPEDAAANGGKLQGDHHQKSKDHKKGQAVVEAAQQHAAAQAPVAAPVVLADELLPEDGGAAALTAARARAAAAAERAETTITAGGVKLAAVVPPSEAQNCQHA